jgi:hypothetical protein
MINHLGFMRLELALRHVTFPTKTTTRLKNLKIKRYKIKRSHTTSRKVKSIVSQECINRYIMQDPFSKSDRTRHGRSVDLSLAKLNIWDIHNLLNPGSQSQLPVPQPDREAVQFPDEVALAENMATSAPQDQSTKRKPVVRYPIFEILLAKNDCKEAEQTGMVSTASVMLYLSVDQFRFKSQSSPDSASLSRWQKFPRKVLPPLENPNNL